MKTGGGEQEKGGKERRTTRRKGAGEKGRKGADDRDSVLPSSPAPLLPRSPVPLCFFPECPPDTPSLARALLFPVVTMAMSAIGEAAMKCNRQIARAASILIMVLVCAAPTGEAGGGFGIHIGGGGFGVSVGFGDWGVYTRSWSDPHWSIDFNASLSGYGNWVWISGLGRVWRPWVAASWRPYTYGRWVATGYGLTWVAYEPWGYIPHHYGNWAHSSFGWVWVPGYTYSCATVAWVSSGSHVGWYARPPWGWSHAARGFHHGYHHGYRDGYHNGYWKGWNDAQYATYVGWKDLGADNVAHHTVTHRVASQRRIEDLARAPTSHEIRRNGGVAITESGLSRRTVNMNGREITIARPDGMARSIERNAADTTGRALSEEALERRQPLIRARNESRTSEFGMSRARTVSRESRARSADRFSQSSSLDRAGGSRNSTRSSSNRSSAIRSSRIRLGEPSIDSNATMRLQSSGVHRGVQNSPTILRGSESRRSWSAPPTAGRGSSSAAKRPAAQQSQRLDQSPQSTQARARRSVVSSRKATPAGDRASSSRQSTPRVERPSSSRQRTAPAEKRTEQASPRRKR